jgi:hypothetical protein
MRHISQPLIIIPILGSKGHLKVITLFSLFSDGKSEEMGKSGNSEKIGKREEKRSFASMLTDILNLICRIIFPLTVLETIS